MKTVCFFSTLMKLASELGKAEQSGDPVRIEKARLEHDNYKELCLRADEMVIGQRNNLL